MHNNPVSFPLINPSIVIAKFIHKRQFLVTYKMFMTVHININRFWNYVFQTSMQHQCSGNNMQCSTLKAEVNGSSETLYLSTKIHLATFQKTIFEDLLCVGNNQKPLRPAVNSCFYYFVSCQRDSTIFQQNLISQ